VNAPIPAYDAVVLAGGRAARLAGVEKPALLVGGVALLDRVLAAVDGAGRVVVVGPVGVTGRAVLWAWERPPGGGPVAALAAALPLVTAPLVVVLAADLPFLTPAAVGELLAAVDVAGVAVAVDDSGRDQPLLAAWETGVLRAALPVDPVGARARDLLPPGARRVTLAGDPPPWRDCDTPEQLAAVRALAAW